MEQNGVLAISIVLLVIQVWLAANLCIEARKWNRLLNEHEEHGRNLRELILRTEPTRKIRAGTKPLENVVSSALKNAANGEYADVRPASMASLRAMAESSMTGEQARERRVSEFNG